MTRTLNMKVVKTRKIHRCSVCWEIISRGTLTQTYYGVDDDYGFFVCYYHDDCFELYQGWDDWERGTHHPGDVSRKEVKELLHEHYR